MDFYWIEKSYPQTREIANFRKIWPIIPPPPPNEENGFTPLTLEVVTGYTLHT